MLNANVIYGLGQIVLTSTLKKKRKAKVKEERELKDYKLVEEYEGSCEECDREKAPPKCPICEGA